MDNAQPDDVEFTDEETRLGVKIFGLLYFISIALLFLAIVFAIYLGFKGVLWYVAIPIWAVCNLGLRVLKRYLRNIFESLTADMAALQSPVSPDEDSILEGEIETVARPVNAINLSFLVGLAMLAASAVWYGLGVLLRIIF